MFHLLLTMQKVITYKNVIKCKDVTEDPLDVYDFKDDFLLYNKCGSAAPFAYCYGACNSDGSATCNSSTETAYVPAEKDSVIQVDSQYIIAYGRPKQANAVMDAIDDSNKCDGVDVVLSTGVTEKKTFYLITCIMFWIAFLLIVGTFVIAIISVSQCGCCRCCNSVKSIFPMKGHAVNA